jgi:hypothetical protein
MVKASSSDGIDSITSTIRITNESTQPPNAPARMPSTSPPISPNMVARTPTMRVCRLPTSSRDSRSRPRLSAPSGKPSSGPGTGLDCGRTLSSSGAADGSWGAIQGEMIASTTKATVIPSPSRKTGSRRSRRQALAISDTPGVSSTEAAASSSMRALRRSVYDAGPGWSVMGQLVLTRGSMMA